MMAIDRDALVCDLAETYGIFDMYSLPVSTLATLAVGLRDDSRIKVSLQKKVLDEPGLDINTILMAHAVDLLAMILWTKTKDAQKGKNKPDSILNSLMGRKDRKGNKDNKDKPKVYESPSAFLETWKKMGGG